MKKGEKITIGVLIALILGLCGAGYVIITGTFTEGRVNFKEFVLNKEVIKEKEIVGMELKDYSNDEQYILNFSNVVNDIFAKISSKDFYIKNFNNKDSFYSLIEKHFDTTYLNAIKEETTKDILNKVFENIYNNEFAAFYKVKVINFERTLDDKKFLIEITSTNDTNDFDKQVIACYLNNSNKIVDIEMMSELTSTKYTTKEISNDSIINADTHTKFLSIFNEFIKPLKNEKIYSLYVDKKLEDFDYEVNTLISSIELDSKTYLKNLFILGKGNFNNYGVVGYSITDENGEPFSKYTLEFNDGNGLTTINITFNRLTEQIVSVSL